MRANIIRLDSIKTAESLVQRVYMADKKPASARILAFISARAGEGTSTVVREYARALVRDSQQKILLMEAGAKNRAAHEVGIADMLLGTHAAKSAVSPMGEGMFRGVWMGSATPPSAAARMLRADDFRATLLKAFETVIIDASPLERGLEGVMLAVKADSVILVVEAEKTPVPVVMHLRDTLREAGANLAGVVLNKRRYYIPQHIYSKL